MVPNIWSPVKVSYDKHALCGISHWRDQRKSFYGYARVIESRHDVYSTKRILGVTRVEVMRKHGYGNLKENRLTNLSGDNVSDFAIALRMFTRSLVIQKTRGIYPDIPLDSVEVLGYEKRSKVAVCSSLRWLEVVQNAVQNLGVQNVGNQNGLIVVPGINNQNPNGNGNVVAARAEGNAIGNNVNLIISITIRSKEIQGRR
nr:hypothetical protein [Tanacetum cinerariifolium]